MKDSLRTQGFTLLEILLVVLIIGVMTAVGANIINSQSVERTVMNQAKTTEQHLVFLCQKAVFDNQALGIEFNQLGYQIFRYRQPTWQLVENIELPPLSEVVSVELLLDGLSQDLPVEPEGLPQIVCQTDGSWNGFELRFYANNQQQTTDYFVLSTTSPWQLTSTWAEF
ncbi:prepilin-type N-terminal cleavage/methylation domain-containing protein [Marinicella sp. S1101]|uniref:prepilin-type N-terminal cleavage/methylation domain-containing protein n=1 Tax=Marinicella marina TaxID=2996016 RepID=UPI0022610360|nr:prepilin-type N-terminal cleavage/methylation domain-containing protein [Marinicella marina]MCX7554768.1 prepilin-type N-terminal cleavage/methylation domain-containing protein [Marinicella marina]MDJ1140999.1 prepilin-type N-terminal cleavage/methylation domain-containing protein [Marinicella marina]